MKFTKTEAHVFIGKLMDAGFEVSSRVIPGPQPTADLQHYVFTVPFYSHADGEDIKNIISLVDEAAMEFKFKSRIRSDANYIAAMAEMDMVIS